MTELLAALIRSGSPAGVIALIALAAMLIAAVLFSQTLRSPKKESSVDLTQKWRKANEALRKGREKRCTARDELKKNVR